MSSRALLLKKADGAASAGARCQVQSNSELVDRSNSELLLVHVPLTFRTRGNVSHFSNLYSKTDGRATCRHFPRKLGAAYHDVDSRVKTNSRRISKRSSDQWMMTLEEKAAKQRAINLKSAFLLCAIVRARAQHHCFLSHVENQSHELNRKE